ncbi:hypothetical protein [Sphingomonas zeae]
MAWLTGNLLLGICWKVHGYTDAQNAEARRLSGEIERDDRRWNAVLNRVANGG